MGLFGPKKSVEEKNFIKALKDALHMKGKNMPALLAATEAWPTGWQGYWLLGLYYDFAHGKGEESDPAKAQEYFLKAEASARGTQDEAWLNSFMTWYRRPAGNLVKPLTDRAKKVRTLAVALLNCYQYNVPVVMAALDKKDDASAFGSILAGCSSWEEVYESSPICDYFNNISSIGGLIKKDHEDLVKDINAVVKKYNKANDAYNDCMKAISKGKEPNWSKLEDMHAYVLAFNCLNDGPYITGELAAQWDVSSEAALGVQFLFFAARNGNQPAIHELMRLAKASDGNYQLMNSVFRRVHPNHMDMEVYLMEQMLECVKQDDEEAMRLMELYYAEDMAKLSE